MAAEESPGGEVEAAEGAVFADGFDGVLGAGGGEAATGWEPRGDGPLVEFNGQEEDPDEEGAKVGWRVFVWHVAWLFRC